MAGSGTAAEREKAGCLFSLRLDVRTVVPAGFAFQRRPFFYSRSASASAGFIADRAYLGISVVGYFRWPVTILNSDLRNHYSIWRGGGVLAFMSLPAPPPQSGRPCYSRVVKRISHHTYPT